MTRATRLVAPFLAFLILLPLPPSAAADQPEPPTTSPAAFADDHVIVAWREPSRAASVAAAHGLGLGRSLDDGAARDAKDAAPGLVRTRGRAVDEVLAELRTDPNVLYAEPDYRFQLDAGQVAAVDVNDPKTDGQYSLDVMRVRDAWRFTTGAKNLIAVVDTGVQFSHPDLQGRIVKGYDFVNDDSVARDDNGHGTWVAGIIAASANDGYGVAGISWSDKILPVKVMNANGSGYTSTLVSGIRYAARRGAKVINMSIGGFPYSSAVQDAVNYAWSTGAVLVGAAGNNRREETHFPASYGHVVSVSATQEDDEFSNWSSYGPKVDVSAPGASVLTTNCNSSRTPACAYAGDHIFISGTSFATPNTSGVVALLWARHPDWTPRQIVKRLIGSVDDLGYPGWDKYYGNGRVNAYRALGANVAAASVNGADAMEANDSIATAPGLKRGTTFWPTNYPAGDVDYFRVVIPRAGRLDVSVTAVTDGVRVPKSSLPFDPVVELLSPKGARIKLVDNPGDSSATEVASLGARGRRTVIVKVSNWFPNASKVPYSIRADFVDNVAPGIVSHSPAVDATSVNRMPVASVRFDEAVLNANATTFTLEVAATHELVGDTSVAYDSSSKTAQLRTATPLAARTRYRVRLAGVTDTVGNPVPAYAWEFTTGKTATFDPAAEITLESGTFTGYQFSSRGRLLARRTVTFADSASASTVRYGSVRGQRGSWFLVSSGPLGGYWLRHTAGLHLSAADPIAGPPANEDYAEPAEVVFRFGVHTGYRFDAVGHMTKARTISLDTTVVYVAARLHAIHNQYGRWFKVANGPLRSYWVLASDVVYLR